MSYAFDESWDLLSKLDGYKQPKRRILVPKMKLRERVNEQRKINFTEEYKNLMRNLTNQSAKGNNNTQISAGGNVNTNPPQEKSAMDLAMEEIRAAQAQREAHAKQFQEMMSGSFANAFPQNISQEMADMIAAYKLVGMSNEEATELARQQFGE
jgi:hypothetical protein